MKTLRLLSALLLLGTGAFAQDQNAAKLELAREAIGAMNADKMFDGMAAQMKQMALQTGSNYLPPQATPEQRKRVEEYQSKIMDLSMESAKGMLKQMDQVYADVYSEAELKAMVVFFKSPEGQSMLAKQPQVMQRIMPLVQSVQHDMMPQFQKLTEELTASFKADRAAAKAAAAAAQAPAAAPAPAATPKTP